MELTYTGVEMVVPPFVQALDEPGTLSMPLHPWELTHRYTNGYAVAAISAPGHNPASMRLIYFIIEDRRGRFVEFKVIGGQPVAVPPPELGGDSYVEGLMVNPQFIWIDAPNGWQQLRLYVVAARDDGSQWTLRFAYSDPKIYRVRQQGTLMDEQADKSNPEITDDATTLRVLLQQIINVLRAPDGRPKSRENALAVTKLQEARFWLTEGMMND